jgi:hypothetical protein
MNEFDPGGTVSWAQCPVLSMRIMERIRWSAAYALILLLLLGCGGCGTREKSKNSDFDRPKPTEKK